MIIVVDFGSQTTHLIARRLKEIGVETKITSPEETPHFVKSSWSKAKGIILSGGPSSVYEKNVPTVNVKIFSLKIPILGICYGFQLMSHLMGGKVVAGKKEYGPASLKLSTLSPRGEAGNSPLSTKLPQQFTVWMSHGDEVIKLPKGFEVVGSSDGVPFAFVENKDKKIYGLQFHPEVEHTEFGLKILSNFVDICNLKTNLKLQSKFRIQNLEFKIRETVGEKNYVIGAVSGGVDSTVAATLTAKAIGDRFIPIFVDNGLMRDGTEEHVFRIFKKIDIKPITVNTAEEMLKRLKKITDSEKKRKIIGNFYIEIFEKEMKKLKARKIPVKFLLQGTIYSDVIESQGSKHSARIKSHHNVGGLPKKMKLKLLEPMRDFYKDEVREIGKKLGLPEEFVNKQPFPGPGFAVRIRGEVTKERLEQEKMADSIVLEELKKGGFLENVFLSFPVMTGAFSTAVKGDGRQFGEVVALRIVESKDIMTSTWSRLPYEVLQKISSRIVNEVPNISRVVYDITTKPPATMEWE